MSEQSGFEKVGVYDEVVEVPEGVRWQFESLIKSLSADYLLVQFALAKRRARVNLSHPSGLCEFELVFDEKEGMFKATCTKSIF